MTYTLNIDQEFAVINDLSLVQVTTLSACISLMVWSKTITIDGKVWYQYSENKMAEDFPLLFGIPKRCYKNVADLADMGYIEITKIGKEKYLTFTAKCADWGKQKGQIRNNSPKTDEIKSENGQMESPKTDANNNIIITNSISDKDNVGVADLFPEQEIKVEKQRGTTEPLCLFANSRYNRFEDFAACFTGPEFTGIDIAYYYGAVADWSAQHAKKKNDWIATARNFMRSDNEKNKLHRLAQAAPNSDYMNVLQRAIGLCKN